MPSSSSSRSPGKIILSGEHAVVYGHPALVMAVNRYAEVRIEKLETPSFTLFMSGETQAIYPMAYLAELKRDINLRYERFISDALPIQDVVSNPGELIAYAAALFYAETQKPLDEGVQVEVDLGIPLSSGMGSSAAVILSVLDALCGLYDVTWNKLRLYEAALKTENLQHGHSSGVDPYTCLHGGVLRFVKGQPVGLALRPRGLQLVHTGIPESSTGECVAHVREQFGDSALWSQFEGVTAYMESALADNRREELKVAINKNHDLLCVLGVVPLRVQEFIDEVLRLGGSAKICGAGSIRGDAAGMVLVDLEQGLQALCASFGYTLMECEVDEHGTRRM